jgi:cyclopropane-fatty-acyl-phospholipid synthase
MTELIIPSKAPELSELKIRRLDQIARKAAMSLLNRLVHGRITIVEDHHQYNFGEPTVLSSLQAVISVHHPQFYSRIFFGGSIGAAEAYMDGLWTADDLTAVMRILALNQKAFGDMEKGLARLTAPLYKLYHFMRKNTRTGSRENILAHYDLGNEFYALFLDETMTYSCGIFEAEDSTLKAASEAKYDRIASCDFNPAFISWKSAPAGVVLPFLLPRIMGPASPPRLSPTNNTGLPKIVSKLPGSKIKLRC